MLSPSRLARSADLMTGILYRIGKTLIPPGAHATRARAAVAHNAVARNMVPRCAACPDQDGFRRLQVTALRLARPPVHCTNACRIRAQSDA